MEIIIYIHFNITVFTFQGLGYKTVKFGGKIFTGRRCCDEYTRETSPSATETRLDTI